MTATLADLQALERLIEGLPAEKLAAIAQLPAVQQRLRQWQRDPSDLGDRLVEIMGHDDGYPRQPPTWRGEGNRLIEFRGCEMEKDKQRYTGTTRGFSG